MGLSSIDRFLSSRSPEYWAQFAGDPPPVADKGDRCVVCGDPSCGDRLCPTCKAMEKESEQRRKDAARRRAFGLW